MPWIKIAGSVAEISFNTNSLAEVVAGGRTFCIGRFKGKLFAFAPKCHHAGGQMAAGWIDPMGNVVCPLHRYKFCMINGRNISGEGYYLKQWPLETQEDGSIWIELKENSIFELLSGKEQ